MFVFSGIFLRKIFCLKNIIFFTDCLDDEYDCDDDTCIANDLECNGRVNCKFLKDESECEVSFCAAFQSFNFTPFFFL